MRLAAFTFACALGLMMVGSTSAQTINASLNLYYTNPENLSLGGAWEVVIKTSAPLGISGVNLRLANINPGAVNEAPRGNVNGTDPAGFSLFELLAGSYLIAQEPLFHAQEGMFYGVGFIPDGQPGVVGVAFSPPPTNLQDTPWATGDELKNDPFWDNAARFLSGTFGAIAPSWNGSSTANVFISNPSFPPTSSSPAPSSPSIEIQTDIRDNIPSAISDIDYNNDGIVDAADYVLWRHGSPLADGNNDTFVNEEDYDLWVHNFGATTGGGGGSNASFNVVPEPASGLLWSFAAAFVLFLRGKRGRFCVAPAVVKTAVRRDRFLRD